MCEARVRACAISRPVRDALPKMPAVGRVLAVFRRACIVEYGRDGLLALVAPDLGNGPLNVVMEHVHNEWSDLQPGMPVQFQGGCLQLGRLEVSLVGVEAWEPCPDWERLRSSAGKLLGRLEQLLAQARRYGPGDTLLVLFQGRSQAELTSASAMHARVRRAAETMRAGWGGDEAQLSAGTAELAGLGGGLTPAGDDFILGAMLCAWLAHPKPGRYCETVLDACSPRTTMLSNAFLRSAAAGECNAAWHRLLEALESGSAEQLKVATRKVLSYGHSSGADALAGFLWMGLRPLEN